MTTTIEYTYSDIADEGTFARQYLPCDVHWRQLVKLADEAGLTEYASRTAEEVRARVEAAREFVKNNGDPIDVTLKEYDPLVSIQTSLTTMALRQFGIAYTHGCAVCFSDDWLTHHIESGYCTDPNCISETEGREYFKERWVKEYVEYEAENIHRVLLTEEQRTEAKRERAEMLVEGTGFYL